MRIRFSPQYSDAPLPLISVADETLTIDGELLDLSGVQEGELMAAPSPAFAGPVIRESGQLVVTLLLPHGPHPSPEQAFPADIVDPPDGPVELPSDSPLPEPEPDPEPTPEELLERERASMEVTRFQARAALHLEGLLDQVQAIMDTPNTDPLTVIAWQDAQVFRRASPTIAAIAQQIGLTDEQVDDLFRMASTIDA